MALVVQVFADGRSAERHQVNADGTVRGSRKEPIDARVLDVSETGFRIATEVPFEIGQQITLGFGGWGRRDARIVRADGSEYGGEFLVPLPRDELARALDAVTVVEGLFDPVADLSRHAEGSSEARDLSDSKYPVPVRIAVVVGLSLLLWAMIATAFVILD